MWRHLSSFVALVLLCLAALLPASSALHAPLKPQAPLKTHGNFQRRELRQDQGSELTTPRPPSAEGPQPDGPSHGPDQYDYDSAPGYDYYNDYDFTIQPLEVAPEAQPPVDPNYRGLKLAFYYDVHPSREEKGDGQYVREQLMPAVAASLRRSVRVRRPTGPISLDHIFYPNETVTETVDFLLEAFGNISRNEAEDIIESAGDADFLLAVNVPETGSEACPTPNVLGAALALGLHKTTFRPVIGASFLCALQDFGLDLETMVHETLHALGVASNLFRLFQGYNDIGEVLEWTEEKFSPSYEIPGLETPETLAVLTPNVMRVVREHFACATLTGAELEEDGGPGTIYSHWEERIYQGVLMDGAANGGSMTTFATTSVLTDLTLALLQDSGWYDVKYGSQGFNAFGYKAGCAFANGTVEEALASPDAAKYLCAPENGNQYICTHDHVASALCYDYDYMVAFADRSDEDYYEFFSYTEGLQDILPAVETGVIDGAQCVTDSSPPGTRCLKPLQSLHIDSEEDFDSEYAEAPGPIPGFLRAVDTTMCVEMECSPQGEVLINGTPCNPEEVECPDSGYLCDDPGVLTCAATLNDCSGRGDCFKGACYCHLGWGGEDCSVPICVPSVGCPADGGYGGYGGSGYYGEYGEYGGYGGYGGRIEECPESGFCGVPECGAWSVGALDPGLPCKGGSGPF